MAVATACQTDGAVFGISIEPHQVSVVVEIPAGALDLDATDEALLVANLHNAVELVLARHWRAVKTLIE